MFGKKKGKKQEEDGDDDNLPSFSWWTPWKKAVLGTVAAACIGGAAFGIYSCEREARRRAEYRNYVESVLSEYADYSPPLMTSEGCLTPGSEARVLRDSQVMFTVQADRSNIIVIGGAKNRSMMCIRPVDGGQVVGLESRIRLSGLDYGSLEGYVKFRTGLRLTPSLPDILPHEFAVNKLVINYREIPLNYVTQVGEEGEEGMHYYIDLVRLVEHGLLSDDDFDSDLDIRLVSSTWLGTPPSLDDASVAGLDSYRDVPKHIRQYTASEQDFPSSHPDIMRIVDDYEGPDNVLAMMRYALDFTDRSIEYYLPELNLGPIGVMEDGRGDCDDYADLFVTIMRAFGVPARRATGNVTDILGIAITGQHAWAEVYVPFVDGRYGWVLVEPTWADNTEDPGRYIGFDDPRFLYYVDFDVELDTDLNSEFDIFQEHRWVSHDLDRGD
ncbi:transglutaminase-like domain-containing protein [Candidatus Woesearchaeota archaeon]|nr:transglutaminase-like domain-containing protein [Candidatus Woesearchaeota archaeon]